MLEERLTPLAVSRGQYFRYRIVFLGRFRALLLLTFHHSIADGWSIPLYSKCISESYSRNLESSERNEVYEPQKSYCPKPVESSSSDLERLQETLCEVKPAFVDPFARTSQLPNITLSRRRVLARRTVERIRGDAKRNRVTVFMNILRTVASVICDRFGLNDLIIGTTSLGRTSATELKAGGAYFRGTLIPLRNFDGSQQNISSALISSLSRRALYHEQKALLCRQLGASGEVDPAIFVVGDHHPLEDFELAGLSTKLLSTRKQLQRDPLEAHTPSCGRLSFFW